MTKPTANNNSGTNSNNSGSATKKQAMTNSNNGSDTSHNNVPANGEGPTSNKKPRRSIKIEGNCLSNMLKEGYAKITDASKLGKRLSSEIWTSFGAIHVPDDFSNPAIQTKTVANGPSTVKICHYFVACGYCYSVFKYDGHAYGTTGLVKHLKNCNGTQRVKTVAGDVSGANNQSGNATNNNSTSASNLDAQNVEGHNGLSTLTNGPISTFTKRKKSRTISLSQPSIKSLVRAIDDLRNEQNELKQEVQKMMNMMSSNCMGQIQIITNEGDKVDEEFRSAN